MQSKGLINLRHGLRRQVAQLTHQTRLVQRADVEDQDNGISRKSRLTGRDGHGEEKAPGAQIGGERNDCHRGNPLVGYIALYNQHWPSACLLNAHGGVQIGQEDVATTNAHLRRRAFLGVEECFILQRKPNIIGQLCRQLIVHGGQLVVIIGQLLLHLTPP